MDKNIISSRLKLAMNSKNMKQVDIVNKTGINKGALSSYLSGNYLPKSDTIYKLANVLEVNPLWLMGYASSPDPEEYNNLIGFNITLRELLIYNKMTEQDLAISTNINLDNIIKWRKEEGIPNDEELNKICTFFKIDDNNDLFDGSTFRKIINSYSYNNATPVEFDDNPIKIPILGVIKAGIPIEAQQDILEYVEIPKSWVKGGKQYFGLLISGDSMFPKYNDKDIVIFEKTEDMQLANNKDCAVMVNGDDATFKKVLINDSGIVLVPYNNGAYDMKMYSKEDIINKPIKIIGIAREKRTKV